jgi:5-methylcytosine-specific restriction protein A
MYNIYYDGKYIKMIINITLGWKKYYQMALIAFMGISLYVLIKKNPSQCKDVVTNATQFIKFLPIDKETKDFITPIVNMGSSIPNLMNTMTEPQMTQTPLPQESTTQYTSVYKSNVQVTPNLTNKPRIIKRSVSETKKKIVASSQNWKCKKCNNQLNAWYEIDHNISLEDGGTNDVENLIAYCRECHGEKTALSRM